MKLHKDKYAFLTLIHKIHDRSRIREDILEKDYYVTLLLKELSEKQEQIPAYFKGGTALYKALKSIRRFSEDIDLTVDIGGCSSSQAKKRLELASRRYRSLPRTSRHDLEDNRKGSITTVYDYTPVAAIDSGDPLQRFGIVKIEATSFTVSEPFSTLEIEPSLYTFSSEDEKNILAEQFDVFPFPIKTICLERIFADKIFAAEFYHQRSLYFDTAKHIYDVSVMLQLDPIQKLLKDDKQFHTMLNYKRLEETRRIGSDLSDKHFRDFRIFKNLSQNKTLSNAYLKMQRNYIFSPIDTLPYEYIIQQWSYLEEALKLLDT